MRIKRFDIVEWIIICIILLEVSLFYFRFLGNTFFQINYNQQEILAVSFVFLFLLFTRFYPLKMKGLLFSNNISVFLCISACVFIYSLFRHNQGVSNVFVASNWIFMILFYYCLMYFFYRYSIFEFEEFIIVIATINMTFQALQYLLYRMVGFVFLYFDAENTRMGVLRLSKASSAICFLGVIFAFANILEKSKSKKFRNVYTFILGVVSFVFLSRGRVAIIALFIVIVSMLAFAYRKNAVKILLGGAGILILAIVILNFSSIGKYYMNSFATEDTGSFRVTEMTYYLDQIYETPIFGIGFIRLMGTSSEATRLLTGPNFHYSRTDVGLVGFISTFGIVGLIWYIALLIKLFKYLLYVIRAYYGKYVLVVLGVFVWNIVYLPSMILFSPYSLIVLPIELAIVNYVYNTQNLQET